MEQPTEVDPPGDDWIVVKLGAPGVLSQVIFDTKRFKGNYPDTVALDALYWPNAPFQHWWIRCWTEIIPHSTRTDNAHLKTIEDHQGPWTRPSSSTRTVALNSASSAGRPDVLR